MPGLEDLLLRINESDNLTEQQRGRLAFSARKASRPTNTSLNEAIINRKREGQRSSLENLLINSQANATNAGAGLTRAQTSNIPVENEFKRLESSLGFGRLAADRESSQNNLGLERFIAEGNIANNQAANQNNFLTQALLAGQGIINPPDEAQIESLNKIAPGFGTLLGLFSGLGNLSPDASNSGEAPSKTDTGTTSILDRLNGLSTPAGAGSGIANLLLKALGFSGSGEVDKNFLTSLENAQVPGAGGGRPTNQQVNAKQDKDKLLKEIEDAFGK